MSFRANARNLGRTKTESFPRFLAFARNDILVRPFPFAVALLLTFSASADNAPVRFNRDVLPLFVKNCFACHGADPAKRKADFRVDDDSALYKALPSGSVPVVPGDRTTSELWKRISANDADDHMPRRIRASR